MIHRYEINGLTIETGDLICTTDTGDSPLVGQFWRFIGMLVPGDVDHIAIYVGPDGRCVEAGAKLRVVEFAVRNNTWDATKMVCERGPLMDVFYGVAYPLAGKGMPLDRKIRIRERVARYCLKQASEKKPFNLNLLDSRTEKAFYCSQLAYRSYLRNGIDLNTGKGIPKIPGTTSIIFPQEIWSGCQHKKAK